MKLEVLDKSQLIFLCKKLIKNHIGGASPVSRDRIQNVLEKERPSTPVPTPLTAIKADRKALIALAEAEAAAKAATSAAETSEAATSEAEAAVAKSAAEEPVLTPRAVRRLSIKDEVVLPYKKH